MKFFPVLIALIMVSQNTAMAVSMELRVSATIMDVNNIQSFRSDLTSQTDNNIRVKIGVQIGGIPQMSINIGVSNDPSNKEYILNKEGRSLILIDEQTFSQKGIGTIQINY